MRDCIFAARFTQANSIHPISSWPSKTAATNWAKAAANSVRSGTEAQRFVDNPGEVGSQIVVRCGFSKSGRAESFAVTLP
ncbi:MAG: hypothetical protein KDA87_03435 [Planctomycetales bacterium]|nr:hypothetical protein [Planctomycetales bacterium]